MNSERITIRLEPWGTEIHVEKGLSLASVLAAEGVEFPCGGTGSCGGCRVLVLAGVLPVTSFDQSVLSPVEIAQGWRLACEARAESSLVLECSRSGMDVLGDDAQVAAEGKEGFGIAIDLGTTTIAAQLIDLISGNVLAVSTALNPQAAFGSDVMSRICAARSGADLTSIVRTKIGSMVAALAVRHEARICSVVLVGNTVMHHLFCGVDVEPLSYVPFESPNLAQRQFHPQDLGWTLGDGCIIRFVRCIGGFVGSDILAGIVATGMAESEMTTGLIDLGTNGEIVVGNRQRIVCASTAAGPAFEAGSIRMGMRAAAGAIAHVSEHCGHLSVSVIGGEHAMGICGSGVVDAVAAGLGCGAITASGRVADGSKVFAISDPVKLFQSDVRELQLAKAAIAAGLRLILARLRIKPSDLGRVSLAGAFGNYVRVRSAVAIGLIEMKEEKIHVAGNTALRGAKMLLAGAKEPSTRIEHVSLAALPEFQEEFASCMPF